MKRAFIAFACLGGAAIATAQPANYTNLGTIGDTQSDYNIPDFTFRASLAPSTVNWYLFTITGATSPAGSFFDIDLFATGTTAPDTEIGLFDSIGTLIANDDDDGHSVRSALTFGNTTPRTMPPDPFGFTNGLAANGRDGNIGPGSYWLSISTYNTAFAGGWSVTPGTGAGGDVDVNFRTDMPVPEPASLAALGLGIVALARRRFRK